MKQDAMDDKIKERCKTCEKQCMQEDLDRSTTIEQKPTSMDRESVEDLSARQKVSRWIKKLLRSYQDEIQKARWIEIPLIPVKKRRTRGSIDRKLSKGIKKLSRLLKNSFSKKRKTQI